MPVTLDSRISVPEGVVFREIQGESVLLHLDTGEYFGLNEVGTRVWQLLGASATLRDVLEGLRQEYEVETEQLEEDLLGLIAELAGKHLVILDAG